MLWRRPLSAVERFLPKIDTPLLDDVNSRRFQMVGPHDAILKTRRTIKALTVSSQLTSDRYTNIKMLQFLGEIFFWI